MREEGRTTYDLGAIVRAVLDLEERSDQAAAAGITVSDLEAALAEPLVRRTIEAAARRLQEIAERAVVADGLCRTCAAIGLMTSEEQNRRLLELLTKARGISTFPEADTKKEETNG